MPKSQRPEEGEESSRSQGRVYSAFVQRLVAVLLVTSLTAHGRGLRGCCSFALRLYTLLPRPPATPDRG